MSQHKKELIQHIADQLLSYGYRVFISGNGEYGFYTDGKRVISFGGQWKWSVDFSGNYRSKSCGTGWQIAKELCDITEDQAHQFIQSNPPHWATNGESVTMTTPEQHLKMYQSSSKYTEVKTESKTCIL